MAQNKFTKIVATVSDRRCDADFIKKLYDNGLNVVRMNSAHLQREGFQRIIDNVRQVSDRIGILMDTKGPEIRTTTNPTLALPARNPQTSSIGCAISELKQ